MVMHVFLSRRFRHGCALGALALLPCAAHAQADAADAIDSGDTALVIATALIAIACTLPGAALFAEIASLRRRAAAAIAGAIAAAVALLWIMVGYTIAFGTVSGGWIGAGNAWMLIDLANVREGSAIPEVAFAALQLGWALLAANLLAGGWAGRGNPGWAIPFAALWSVIVHAPVVHWIAGGGWLASRLGTVDQAGSAAFALSAGASALVLALLIGRRARFDADPTPDTAHCAGAALLMVAILALTLGNALGAGDDAAAALVNALAGAAAGGLTMLMIAVARGGAADPVPLARGALVGIAATAAAASAMAPGGAIVAGAAGAVVAWIAARMLRAARIDDPLGVIATFGAGGMAGAMLAAPLIAGTLGGSGYAAGMGPVRQVVAQAIGAGAIAAWSAVGTAIAALTVAMVVPLRIGEAEETGD